MCAVNCPVGINTGTFIKEIRAKNQSQLSERAGVAMQGSWGQIAALAGIGLRVANKLPFLAKNAANLLAAMAPRGTTPKWDKHVVGAGFRRSKLKGVSDGTFSYLPS